MTARSGFTLIEALVACLVIGLVFTGLLNFFPTLTRVNRGTQEDQTMTLAAKALLEEVRSAWAERANFDAATLGSGAAVHGYTVANTPGMTCQAGVSDPDGGAYAPVRRKLVTLTCTVGANSTAFAIEFGRPL